MAGEKEDDPQRFVTEALCDERVKRVEGKVDDLKKRLDILDNRLWMLLGGTIIMILLTLIQIALRR